MDRRPPRPPRHPPSRSSLIGEFATRKRAVASTVAPVSVPNHLGVYEEPQTGLDCVCSLSGAAEVQDSRL